MVLICSPDHQMAMSIFSAGKEVLGEDDEHLLHQMALYEMHRPNGSLQESANLLRGLLTWHLAMSRLSIPWLKYV